MRAKAYCVYLSIPLGAEGAKHLGLDVSFVSSCSFGWISEIAMLLRRHGNGMHWEQEAEMRCWFETLAAVPYGLGSNPEDGDIKRRKETRERGARPWMEKREKPCPGWRKHERRALVGTDGKRALKKRSESEIGVERR
ncbi:hypothetical protein TNCV_1519601 [Trichonephila clavipes]|nr:hypothetical protein TNCV_1519601 [Trichonephila clavipes]